MKKIGNLISVFELESHPLGKIHRGFKLEKEKKERILFYEIPFSLKFPEEIPQHISILDVIYKETGKEYSILAHPYISGFPLTKIIQRAERDAFPMPVDHCLLIVERVISAFEDFKLGFPHPFFIWLTFDGEVKCSPVPLPRIFQKIKIEEIKPYLSPQIIGGEEWGRAEQVYSVGALFFEILTGKQLPPPEAEDPVVQAILKTPLMVEGNIPKDLQVLLLKSLNFKSSERFQHIKDLREELGKLIYSGAYSPTTFNLAFFMHSLFREEIDKEEKILSEEDKIDLKPILEPPKIEVPEKPLPEKAREEIKIEEKKKSPFLYLALSALAIIFVIFSIFMFKGKKVEEKAPAVLIQQDEEEKRKLEEYERKIKELEEQARKQREELERLQKEASKSPEAKKELEKKKEEQRITEEKLKEMEQKKKEVEIKKETASQPSQKLEQAPLEIEKPASQKVEEIQKEIEQKQKELEETTKKEEQKKAEEQTTQEQRVLIKEGQLVPVEELDTVPVVLKKVEPEYPPIAKKQKQKCKVTLKVLVNHLGDPEEIVVVSVSNPGKYGFDQAAIEAVKKWKFQPGTKNGVKVKCWFWVPIHFGE